LLRCGSIILWGDNMKEIFKFNHELLEGEDIHLHRRYGDTSYKSHWHTYYEIILYLDCRGNCILNGENHEIKGDCIYFLTPQDFHKINTEYNENSQSVIISFSEKFFDDPAMYNLFTGPRILYDVPQTVTQKILEMHSRFKRREPYFKEYLKNLLNCVLLDIAANSEMLTKNAEHLSPAVRSIITYLHQNPNARISLKEAASKAGLTPTYFSNIFHSEVGQSFMSYRSGIQLSYAKRLLEETDLSVLEVALECGYGSVSQFHRAFKGLTSTTPKEYRKSKRS